VGNEKEWILEKSRSTLKITIELDKGKTGIHIEI